MVTIDIDQIKQVFENTGGNWDAAKDKLLGLSAAAAEFGENIELAMEENKDFINSFIPMSKMSDIFAKVSKSAEEAKKQLKESGMGAAAFGLSIASLTPVALRTLPAFSTFGEIGKNAEDASFQISDLTDKLDQMGAFGAPGGKTAQYIKRFAEASDAARNFENQIIRNAAASGQLDDMLKSSGGRFEDLERKMLQFSNITADVGTATGLTSRQVAAYANDVAKIPGMMDQVISSSNAGGQSILVLEGAIKVARGSGQNFADVLSDLDTITQDFGATGEEALQTISRMHSATQVLNLRMSDVRTYVKNAGEQFKFFGDNSSGAIDVLARFGPALQASGLGPKAITDLVSGVTTGIAGMTTAQRAFLAQQTGMGGGLTGALQVEQELAEGKVGDVVGRIQEALTKIGGGKILTREQAIEGGEPAARQFELQRQLLMRGPFGQLASNEQGAARLLEAMAKGQMSEMSDAILGKDEALASTIQAGTDLTERQTSVLVEANNELSKISNLQSQTAANTARAAIGLESLLAESMKGFLGGAEEASTRAAQQRFPAGEGIETGPLASEEFERFGQKLENIFGGIVDKFKKAGTGEEETPMPGVGEPIMSERPTPIQFPLADRPQVPNEAVAPDIRMRAEEGIRASRDERVPPGDRENIITILLKSNEGEIIRIVKAELDSQGRILSVRESDQLHTSTHGI